MNELKTKLPATIILIFMLTCAGTQVFAQRTMPEVLENGTLEEQLEYLDERTRIYNDFRAVREDMFQKIKTNSMDSLRAEKRNVLQLKYQLAEQSTLIESQQTELQSTNEKLDLAIKNRDRLTFIGIPMHKALYNTILWVIIAGLAFISVVLFLSNKRLLSTSRVNKKDLEDTREEFEAYRKSTRERQEQLVVKHHNELRKLRGN